MSDRTRPLGRYGGPEGAPRIILLRGVYEDTEVTNRRLKWTGAAYAATDEQITFYRKSGTTPITLSEDEETVVVWRSAAGRYEELAASGTADIIYARVNNTGGTSADTNLYNYDSGVSITGCVTASATGQFRNNGQTIDDNQWVILVKRQDTGEYEPEQVGGEATGNVIYAQVNEGSGVTSGDSTFSFDNAVAVVGSTPGGGTGTAQNQYSQSYSDDDWVLLFQRRSDSAWITERFDASGNIVYAQVNEASGVTSANGTFSFDNAVAIAGTSPGSGTATNVHSQKYANNEWLLLFQRKSDNAWVTGRRSAAIFTGTAYASFAEGDSTLQVESLTAIWGEAPTTTPLTVANTLKLTGATGDAVLCVENDDGTYLGVNNAHRIIEWLKDQSGYNASKNQTFGQKTGTPTWWLAAHVVLGTTTAAVESTDTTFGITVSETICGPTGTTAATIQNTFDWDLDSGANVIAIKGSTNWYPLQAECPA